MLLIYAAVVVCCCCCMLLLYAVTVLCCYILLLLYTAAVVSFCFYYFYYKLQMHTYAVSAIMYESRYRWGVYSYWLCWFIIATALRHVCNKAVPILSIAITGKFCLLSHFFNCVIQWQFTGHSTSQHNKNKVLASVLFYNQCYDIHKFSIGTGNWLWNLPM